MYSLSFCRPPFLFSVFRSAAFFIIMAVLFFIFMNYLPAYCDNEFFSVWEKFLGYIEKKDAASLSEIVSQDSPEEFLNGIGEQMKAKDNYGLEALKKLKYIKTHLAGGETVKLGFEAPSRMQGGEFLWVILRKENGVYKIFNIEPANSLKFYKIILSPVTGKETSFKHAAPRVVETLKTRLIKNKYTDFNFSVDYEARRITLVISGIDSVQSFTDFITRRGYFSLRPLTGVGKLASDDYDELLEYTYFSKKNPRKYRVLKKEIINNESGVIAASEVTFSGLRVPRVQIDLNSAAKEKLSRYTGGFTVGEGESRPALTLACVLDYRVLAVFECASRISSGRFWIEDITLTQAARMINAFIAAGPLEYPVEIIEFEEK